MRYALNVTPINGWQTQLGVGIAHQQLQSNGVGYLIMVGKAQAAILALTPAGLAAVVLLGVGQGPLALILTGRGYAVIRGEGAALAELEADGNGILIPFLGGQAAMIMTGFGFGAIAADGRGLANLQLECTDESSNSIASRGAGFAAIIMAGLAGIPRPSMIRDDGLTHVASRRMLVAQGLRRMTVAPEPRAIDVPMHDHVTVEQEKGL